MLPNRLPDLHNKRNGSPNPLGSLNTALAYSPGQQEQKRSMTSVIDVLSEGIIGPAPKCSGDAVSPASLAAFSSRSALICQCHALPTAWWIMARHNNSMATWCHPSSLVCPACCAFTWCNMAAWCILTKTWGVMETWCIMAAAHERSTSIGSTKASAATAVECKPPARAAQNMASPRRAAGARCSQHWSYPLSYETRAQSPPCKRSS